MPKQRRTIPFLQADQLPDPIPAWEYHAHSSFSDGQGSLIEVTNAAIKAGLTTLYFTEHTEPDLVSGPDWFRLYYEELRQLREMVADKIAIGIGLEVPVTDLHGGLQMSQEMEEQADFILGAVHAYPGYGWSLREIEPTRAIDLEFQSLMSLAENPRIDAIAHPGGICQLYITPFPMELFAEVVRKATSNGIAIEINPAYQQPIAPYLEICQHYKAMISPGSNAHAPMQLGRAQHALQAWLDKRSKENA